jgi:DNA-binding PadR family transcriptional regulator
MSAYQVLIALDSRFGNYEASTGTICPAVSALRSEQLIERDCDGHPYRLTTRGRQALEGRRDVVARVELRTGVRFPRDASVDAMIDAFITRLRHLGETVSAGELATVLERTTRELHAIAQSPGATG